MVQNLNLILLTAPELEKLRRELMAMASPESFSLFVELYKSWCHSPVATLALCLLAQVYDHACELLDKFAWLEVTVELLVEVRSQTSGTFALCPLNTFIDFLYNPSSPHFAPCRSTNSSS